MPVFCRIAKAAAEDKTNVFLEIDLPKKAMLLSSEIECYSTKLDSSCCTTTVVFPNRL